MQIRARASAHGWRGLAWLPAVAAAAVAIAHCDFPGTGFACGKPLDTDHTINQVCPDPQEVCICAINACAYPEYPPPAAPNAPADGSADGSSAGAADTGVAPGEGGSPTAGGSTDAGPPVPCPSGWRFAEEPYAPPQWAGRCLDTVPGPWSLPPGSNGVCPAAADATVEASTANDATADGPSESSALLDAPSEALSEAASDAPAETSATGDGAPSGDAAGDAVSQGDASPDGGRDAATD